MHEHAGTMWTWSIIMVITPPCIIKKSGNLRGPSIAKTACYDMMTYVQEWPEQCECRAEGDWGGGTTVLWPGPEQLGQVWVRRNSTRFLTTSSHGGYKHVIWTWYDFCTNLSVVHRLWHIRVGIPVVCRKRCLYLDWSRVNKIWISSLSSHMIFGRHSRIVSTLPPLKAAVLKRCRMEGLSTCYRSKLAQEDPLGANQSAFKPEYPPISRLFVPFPPG